MMKSQKSRDYEVAFKIHEQNNCFGITENAILPKNDKENYKPRTLIDQTLELIDPTPNIYTLFMQFNERFFWNKLLPVEVKWSPRMTSCAGVCTFHPRNRQCVISLSVPLLKLRPRKDLVETLLHEMIHGYLFLTNNNRDRDGHGPEFCKHMNRINASAGTKITIYHSFHDEVKLYQQHWWRCNGPCQKRAPYFGTVRRAMNRAPGPSDFWWKEHQQTCGGQFIKIKEPENFKAKGSKNKEKIKSGSKNKKEAKPAAKSNNTLNNMFNWLTKTTSHVAEKNFTFIPKNNTPSNNQNSLSGFKKLGTNTNNVHGWSIKGPGSSNSSQKSTATTVSSTPSKSIKPPSSNQSPLSGFKKLGTNTNNVHGWGIGGPGTSNNSQKSTPTVFSTQTFSTSGVLGGSVTGKSNLLNKFDTGNHQKSTTLTKKAIDLWTNGTKTQSSITNNKKSLDESNLKLVECPICSNFVPDSDINKHIDSCLVITSEKIDKTEQETISKVYSVNSSNSQIKADNSPSAQKRKNNTSTFSSKQIKLDNSENLRKANCPVCNKNLELTEMNEHLDKCLSTTSQQNNSTILLDDRNCKNETKDDSIVSISSTSSSNESFSSNTENLKDTYPISEPQKNDSTEAQSHKCLVCNTVISPEISLNDHLEDCIGSVFNDDSILSDGNNTEMSETASEISFNHNDHKYPCPVCMQLISESSMNRHLDECLEST